MGLFQLDFQFNDYSSSFQKGQEIAGRELYNINDLTEFTLGDILFVGGKL